jgi:hypothetical protein
MKGDTKQKIIIKMKERKANKKILLREVSSYISTNKGEPYTHKGLL